MIKDIRRWHWTREGIDYVLRASPKGRRLIRVTPACPETPGLWVVIFNERLRSGSMNLTRAKDCARSFVDDVPAYAAAS
jgi:hypothetical protein